MNNKLGGRCGTGNLRALQAKRKIRRENQKGRVEDQVQGTL